MELAFVELCGFRGFRERLRMDFSQTFTVIDGRNGVGKSTIFDAVEFALTGTISKYLDATAAGESVVDYLWWNGEGSAQADRFVEVGFRDGEEHYSVRRTPLDPVNMDISQVVDKLLDKEFAPGSAISQLCAASIIRDEHIARLSLDLKEGDRFALLRDAIGAIDSGSWIDKASRLVSATRERVKAATGDLEQTKGDVLSLSKQVDRIRSEAPVPSVIAETAAHLQTLLDTKAPADQLGDLARRRLAEIGNRLETVHGLLERWADVDRVRGSVGQLERNVAETNVAWTTAYEDLQRHIASVGTKPVSTTLSQQARQLEGLAALGRVVGIRDGHCPLCASAVTETSFNQGLGAAITIARELDTQAVEQAERERARDDAQKRLEATKAALDTTIANQKSALSWIADFDSRLGAIGLSGSTANDLMEHREKLQADNLAIAEHLRLLDTTSVTQGLARVTESLTRATDSVQRAESRFGRARLAETRAKAVHDAVRRAAAETLDQRLDRVLPLMAELYQRLRPHPVWKDIEYSVRGDVRRFLRLQVGGDVNPQFVFSSGQRRATGLAFLLSINLAIAWNRWRSILLDDPVQHIDDFRAIHLAEVLAHLCQGGRQIVCAVEDSALADLMCRRLSTSNRTPGKRVTLGNAPDGSLSVTRNEAVPSLHHRSLVLPPSSLSA